MPLGELNVIEKITETEKFREVHSESEVIILLLFFTSCSSTTSTTDSPCWLCIIQQVENVVHEVIFMRVLLVLQASFKGLLEDSDDVCAICS